MIRNTTFLVLLALGTTIAACGGGSGPTPPGTGTCPTPPSGTSMTPAEEALGREVLQLVNEERSRVGVGAVVWDAGMAQVAFEHAWDMDARNYFAHVSPCGDGPADRLDAASISWSAVGENIAMGPRSAALAMAVWMNSAPHRANLIDARFTRCAVGVHDSLLGTWWVMVLRRP